MELGLPAEDLGLEEPPEGVDAVLASSAASRLAAEAAVPLPDVAAQIAAAIDRRRADLRRIGDGRGPVVNIETSAAYDRETLVAARDPDYGERPGSESSVIVEHMSVNPTGPVHVG